jgi:ribosomal protein S18 acetylase RimI-like enzyme
VTSVEPAASEPFGRGVSVRPVAPAEWERLADLTVASYTALRGHLEAEYEAELRDVAVRVGVGEVLVAVDDATGALLGGVTYLPDADNGVAEHAVADEASFRMLAVAVGAQHRGVGEALVRAVIDRARAAGFRRLVLHTTPWMASAHRLYDRLGFRRDPTIDIHPEIPLWGYAMDL